MPKSKGSSEDARIGKTRRALHQALLSLLETEQFDTVSAAAIAKQAGIGYATFFRHYADTRALLMEIAGEFIMALAAQVAPAMLLGEGRVAASGIAAFMDERWGLCRALLVGAGDRIRNQLTEQALVAARDLDALPERGIPRELRLRVSVAASIALLAWWLEHRDNSQGLEDALTQLVFDPMIGASHSEAHTP